MFLLVQLCLLCGLPLASLPLTNPDLFSSLSETAAK